jgi:hypothetical protein
LVVKEQREEARQQGEVGDRPQEELHAGSIAPRTPNRMTVS